MFCLRVLSAAFSRNKQHAHVEIRSVNWPKAGPRPDTVV